MKYADYLEEGRAPSKRKKTARWCRGHVGREHDWDLSLDWAEVKGWVWASSLTRQFKIDVCKNCGKHRWHR